MRLRLIVAIAALTATVSLAHAADWPNRPIHFIVPFPAGGSTDVGNARLPQQRPECPLSNLILALLLEGDSS